MNKEKNEKSILMKYYSNIFRKANITFAISCFGVVIGIVIIFTSVIFEDLNWHILSSSVIIEAVSSLLFVLEDRMRKTAHETMRLIRLDNNNLYCEKILEKIQDEETKDQIICEIIEIVMGKTK